uniref:Cytochrome P450 n=1 Tax=Thanatephorus cucumeris TaxID=107832 RepID=A0A2R4RMM2_THACU|nr:cytochrome P450 [Thanatephorus cucumeris]
MDPLLKYFLVAREHPFEIGVGLLTAFGAHLALKAFRRANAFRQLDGPTPSSSLWGDEALLYDIKTSLTIHDELLSQYGSVCKIKGPLGEDRVWIADPLALSDIVVKGFDDFHEVEGFVAWFALTQGPTIITTSGHKHKMQRKILNPVFTAAHMRNLTPTFNSIAHHLLEIVTSEVRTSGGNTAVVDMHHWMSNVSLEMIGQAGMGHSFGVMTGKEPEYIEASRQLFPLISEMWYIRPFLPALMKIGSAGFRRFVVSYIPFGPVQRLRNITETMDKTAAGIYNQKKRALEDGTLESEITAGNDIMSMMLKQNKNVPPEDQMNEAEIQAQVNGLLFAGHDTTSAALDRTLHLLAHNLEVQDRLRQEVREAHGLHGKNLDYDQLNSLQYLDAVCRESLRLWAPGQLVERTAAKDWNLPLRYPIKSKDGKTMISNLHVRKGTHLYLSLGSVNRDKQTWGDDASHFKPTRWLTPLPGSVAESKIPGVYSNMMTFLGGPRSCIGFKFSQLEMKVILSTLISSFRFETGPEEHFWVASGVLKPHTRRDDGTIDSISSLRLKITLVDY